MKKEIEQFSKEEDKPILLGLMSRYRFSSNWNFLANCTFQSYGKFSYQCNRIWAPTVEGRVIYTSLVNTTIGNCPSCGFAGIVPTWFFCPDCGNRIPLTHKQGD
jgi:hypothetical protein